MTEPQPVMEKTEQDKLSRRIGRSLLTVAGPDWKRVRAEYRSAGRHVEVDVFVTGPDGVERPVRPPQEVVEEFGRLRQGMYRPGRGTWLSALYVLDPPSTFNAEFEPDLEPRWRRLPPPIGFADELRFFPRADEHLPDWLRQRAGLPPAGADQATDGADQPAGGARPANTPTPPPGAARPAGQPPRQPPPGPPRGPQPPGPQPPGPWSGQPTPPGGAPLPGQRTPPPGGPGRPPMGQPAPPPGPPRMPGRPAQPPPPGRPFPPGNAQHQPTR